jgi:acetyl esterase/lipase
MKHYSMIAVLAVFGLSAVVVSTQPFVDQTYKIKSFKDVQYAMVTGFDGRTDTLRMNIVVPTNDNVVKRPLVMWIHGGGFIQGNRADFQALAESWARRGYTAVTISYRLGIHGGLFDPPFAFDEAELIRACFRGIQDIRTGLRFLTKNASQYGIDTSRIVIGGASAGSIVALHAAYIDPLDKLPQAIGKISDVTRANGTFARPDMGSYDGTQHTEVPTPSVDVVLNIFGALLDLSYLDNAPFIPMFSYHQTDDPVVACGVNRPYHSVPLVSANYPFMSGTCTIVQDLAKRGMPTSSYETIIHQGAAHEVHDPLGVDKAAAIFAAKYVSTPTSIAEDVRTPFNTEARWTLYSLHGETVASDVTADEVRTLPDGVYGALSNNKRSTLLVRSGNVYITR